jgi:Leucine-rich repeat (LRR) protein
VVSDLSPVAALTNLQFLDLSQTEVSDLSAIAGMTKLQFLDLYQTRVSDLSRVAGLNGLRSLDLSRTGVSDLRPLIGMNGLQKAERGGLRFSDTPAVRQDENLARMAGVQNDNERGSKVLAYLKTLPPWPEPLPWFSQIETNSRPTPAVIKRREEPPLTRQLAAIRTTPSHVKFILSQPRLTRFTAIEVAEQIRLALAGVKRTTNALPEPLATFEEIADALEEVGNTQLSPKQKQRVEEL